MEGEGVVGVCLGRGAWWLNEWGMWYGKEGMWQQSAKRGEWRANGRILQTGEVEGRTVCRRAAGRIRLGTTEAR